jgi:hypothetical protein
MAGHKIQYKVLVDLQCGACGALIAGQADWEPMLKAGELGPAPRFCPRCASGLERFCLRCHRRAPMYFEEWWPDDRECVRTYSPAKHCPFCKAALEMKKDEDEE